MTNLGSESFVVLEQVEQLARIHLQQHSSNLSGEVGLRLMNLGVETNKKLIVNPRVSNRGRENERLTLHRASVSALEEPRWRERRR